jgi:hypothetical protein
VCLFDGTDREGWYSSCEGDLITLANCNARSTAEPRSATRKVRFVAGLDPV